MTGRGSASKERAQSVVRRFMPQAVLHEYLAQLSRSLVKEVRMYTFRTFGQSDRSHVALLW